MNRIFFISILMLLAFAGNSSAEESCPSGQYLDGEICKRCPTGYYCSGGTEPANKCPAGTYQDSTGYSRCETCPSGSYCPEGSKSRGTRCPDNSTSAPGAKSASDCVANAACEAGYSRNSFGVCSEINIGWYPSVWGSSNCPGGTYGVKAGSTSKEEGCAECPAGFYCISANNIYPCPLGKTSPAGSKSASDCVEADIPAVTSCAPGYYLSNGVCAMCQPGRYCEGGTASSKNCPAGTYGIKSGAVSQDDGCGVCPPGTIQSSSGMTYCQTCAGGAYCSGSSSQACPSGYTSLPGSSECTIPLSCEPGFYQYAGSCQMCGKGTYCPDGINQMRCPEGTYGTKSSAKGFDEACAKCPAGTYNQYTGSSAVSSCQECAAGVSTEGSGFCINSCPAGTVRDGKACRNLPGCKNFADGACQECESDYLKNSEGTCTPAASCKDGMHADKGTCVENDDVNCNTQQGNKCTECKGGYFEQDGSCVTSCGAGYKQFENFCNRIRYTPAEAAEVLHDDDNEIVITFKK